ncbi:MAG TPA: FAD binding domain-containing protein [Thermoanaerobaculia bacterium]|nr:FAD binding domain-containing protein [Thermoanaerobaculia bacterium]
MLRLPKFKLYRPRCLAEAAAILSGEGAGEAGGRAEEDAAGAAAAAAPVAVRLVAGGTDLWPNMKRRHQKASAVVSLMAIPELAGVRNGTASAAGEVRLGATTLLDDVARHPLVAERYPALARAVASISSPPLRNMGTIGGNVCVDTRCTYYNQTEDWRRAIDYCMKEEGKICWVATSSPRCWAHSASDSAPMLCALGARVRLVSRQGERVLPIAELYNDDGIDYLCRRPDEILAEILLPAEAARESCRAAFWKLRRRGSIDFAVLSVAAALWTDPAGRVTRARLFLGAVGSSPVAATAAARLLEGCEVTAALAAEAGRLARKAATPMDNTDFQAQWRGAMAGKYVEAALREAAGLDRERLAPKHLGFET